MKKSALVLAVFSFLFSVVTHAEVAPTTDSFWSELHQLITRCAVQPVRQLPGGRTEALPMQSTCKELKVSDDHLSAVFSLNEQTYLATLTESEDSDGGDLWDLSIDQKQTIAERHNVAAFGDVLLALAGSSQGIVEVKDDEIKVDSIEAF